MRQLYFKNLRLEMGMGGRFLVRLVIYVFYGMLTATMIVILFAEMRWLQSLGFFLILFLGDRLLHLNRGDKKLAYLPAAGRVNLNAYLTPITFSILERSFDQAFFIRGDFFLWLARQLLDQSRVRKLLRKSGVKVKWHEADKELQRLLADSRREKYKKAELLTLTEQLVAAAATEALIINGNYVNPEHLLLALFKREPKAMKGISFLGSVKIKL